jgi:hypothetical protein
MNVLPVRFSTFNSSSFLRERGIIYVEPALDLVTSNAIAIAANKEARTCELHSSSPFRPQLSTQTNGPTLLLATTLCADPGIAISGLDFAGVGL